MECIQSPLEAISHYNPNTRSALGCNNVSCVSTDGFKEAIQVAQQAETIILLLGLDTTQENEGLDRLHIAFPGHQLALFKAMEQLQKPIVVIVLNGGIIGLEYLKHSRWCHSILEAFYPGARGSRAIADVLFGTYNPSGKLPVTSYETEWTDHVNMTNMDMTRPPGRTYRYFNGTPVFPFGWGLSYTSFKLTWKHEQPEPVTISANKDENNGSWNATVVIANTGRLGGAEVIQVYFRPNNVSLHHSMALRLRRQMIGFERMYLEPQEASTTMFTVSSSDLSIVDNDGNRCIVPGHYELIITNGVDQNLTQKLIVQSSEPSVVVIDRFPVQQYETLE